LRFFLDNNLSYRLAEALDILSGAEGHSVAHVAKKFTASAKDVDWIHRLAEEGGWVIVSGDSRIRKRPREREIFFAARLTTFFLAPGWINARFWEQSQLLVRWWPRIIEQSALVEQGAVFEVPYRQTGRFTQLR
jgi:hypothetical protein